MRRIEGVYPEVGSSQQDNRGRRMNVNAAENQKDVRGVAVKAACAGIAYGSVMGNRCAEREANDIADNLVGVAASERKKVFLSPDPRWGSSVPGWVVTFDGGVFRFERVDGTPISKPNTYATVEALMQHRPGVDYPPEKIAELKALVPERRVYLDRSDDLTADRKDYWYVTYHKPTGNYSVYVTSSESPANSGRHHGLPSLIGTCGCLLFTPEKIQALLDLALPEVTGRGILIQRLNAAEKERDVARAERNEAQADLGQSRKNAQYWQSVYSRLSAEHASVKDELNRLRGIRDETQGLKKHLEESNALRLQLAGQVQRLEGELRAAKAEYNGSHVSRSEAFGMIEQAITRLYEQHRDADPKERDYIRVRRDRR